MLSVFRLLSYCTFIVTNMSLPGGSNIFREVLQEFVKPCPYEQSDDSSDDGSKSDEELFVSRKDSPRQKQKRLRVQWADESSQTPLAAEPYETHSARIFTKTVPKPILKCKPNYLIVMPQWTVFEVRRHFQTWWTISCLLCSSLAVKRLSETHQVMAENDDVAWPVKDEGRGGRIQWRYLSGARANAILSMTAIYCNTQYILYAYTFMSVLCTALFNNVLCLSHGATNCNI